MATPTLWLTIDWRNADPKVSPDHEETLTQMLFRELNGYDEVEQVERVPVPDAPADATGAHWLWGILKAEVKLTNLKKLGQEVQERLPGKPLDLEIEVMGETVRVERVRSQILDTALDQLVAAATERVA